MSTRLVCDKSKGCACGACVNVCPKQCITLMDDVKNTYAEVNEDLCINCHLCEKVCQVENTSSELLKLNTTISCKEGISKNNEVVKTASSGGFATQLGIKFAETGGYVDGVKSDKEDFYFDITNNPDEVIKFAGSKYVKVSTGDIFTRVKDLLSNGHKVLFFGTPCQVAAIKLYMVRPQENLYTVDLICHGTPSNKTLKKYLSEKGITSEANVRFRDKRSIGIQMFTSKDGKGLAGDRICDPYMIGFLNGLFYTENCYSCNYAKRDRVSDLTMGDSWGSKREDNKGMRAFSLTIISTEKGKFLFEILGDTFECYDCDYENAIAHNHQLVHSSNKQPYTDYYYENYEKKSMKKLVKKAYPKQYYKQYVKKVLIALRLK